MVLRRLTPDEVKQLGLEPGLYFKSAEPRYGLSDFLTEVMKDLFPDEATQAAEDNGYSAATPGSKVRLDPTADKSAGTDEQVLGSFSFALEHMKQDGRCTRAGWNGRGMWVALGYPAKDAKLADKRLYNDALTQPYFYMRTVTGERVAWLASQSDLLANDWRAV